MGQTLSEPITVKESTHGEGKKFFYGATGMQGWRISMEDAHTTILRLQDKDAAFFAVFDGHGGKSAAKYCGEQMHNNITSQPEYDKGQIEAAIRKGYLQADVKLKDDPEFKKDPAGCTAVSAIITANNEIFCGNAGDSRCILSANGVAVALSEDHKPTLKDETARIVAAGGFVEFGRVNGNLALSRAIGDFEFKTADQLPAEEQIVTANPEIKSRQLQDTDEFVVLACDGIWDVLSSQMVIDFVRQRIAEKMPLATICEQLCDRCLARESEMTIGCDNMTVIIVGVLNGQSKEEWYSKISERYNAQPKRPQIQISPNGGHAPASHSENYLDDGNLSEDPAHYSNNNDNNGAHNKGADGIAPFPALAGDGKSEEANGANGEHLAFPPHEQHMDGNRSAEYDEHADANGNLSPQERAILHDIEGRHTTQQ